MSVNDYRVGRMLGAVILVACLLACSENKPMDEGQAVRSTGMPGAATAEAVQYTIPDGWTKVQPTSSMRKAQFRLPKVEGDPEDGELVAFYFGPGQGGSVEANVTRWVGQFSKADGAPASDTAKVANRQVAGKTVTTVDVSGIYTGSSGPMMQGDPPKAGFRMLAAIIETSQGPWFFKLTGPRGTIEKWETSFEEFVSSLRAN